VTLPLPLPWPFEREYMQLALASGVAVGACAPLIGTFLVQKRLSLMGDGIGHMAFAGVAAGLLAGVTPLWTALVVAVVGAMTIEWLRLRRRASGDLALAVFTVSPADALSICLLGVGIVGVVVVSWRALFTVALDEEAARVAGLPVDALSLGLAALTAVTVVAAMRVVGVLLVAALMVLPVGSAQRLARSFGATMRWAVAIGIGSVVVGLVVARAAALAPGGTIVLIASATFTVTAALDVGRRRGRVSSFLSGSAGSDRRSRDGGR
jgi:zinc transport system permease protein